MLFAALLTNWIFERPVQIGGKTYTVGYESVEDLQGLKHAFLIEKSANGRRRQYYIGEGGREEPAFVIVVKNHPVIGIRLHRNWDIYKLSGNELRHEFGFSSDYTGCYGVKRDMVIMNTFIERGSPDKLKGREVYRILDGQTGLWYQFNPIPDETKVGWDPNPAKTARKSVFAGNSSGLPSEHDRMLMIQKSASSTKQSFGATPWLKLKGSSLKIKFDVKTGRAVLEEAAKNKTSRIPLPSPPGSWFYGLLTETPHGVRGFYEKGRSVQEFIYKEGRLRMIARLRGQDTGLLAYNKSQTLLVSTRRWNSRGRKRFTTEFVLLDMITGKSTMVPSADPSLEKYTNAMRDRRHD